LEDNKIQTRNYFGGNLLLQPAYSELADQWGGYNKVKQLFPNATKATTDTFFLGVSPVITKEQLDYVGSVVDDFMARI
jgi:CDP-6-deoxy-D-xylo-4-hexulose-3-dehydrase